VYRRLNSRFLSCHGCPSHPVVGSRSFAYFLMSPQRTAFIAPKGCPCASNSTRFFRAELPPPFRVGGGCDVSMSSLFSSSESSSVPEWVAYPRLHQQDSTIKETLGALICDSPLGMWRHIATNYAPMNHIISHEREKLFCER
jgi:hypothetical protein